MTTTAAESLTIGEAAKALGLSEDTLRYYEREGLTPPVPRASSGHRRYTQLDLGWFEFIIRMRTTGMSIETLQRYADLTRQGDETAMDRRAILSDHRVAIEKHIEELTAARDVVTMKIDRIDQGIPNATQAPHC